MIQYTKRNFSHDPAYTNALWKCDSCKTQIDTQSHIQWSEAYKNLRNDRDLKSDKDLTQYIKEVLEIRTKMNLKK